MKHSGLCDIAAVEGNDRNGLPGLGDLTLFADYVSDPKVLAYGPIEMAEAAAEGSDPQGAVLAGRQRNNLVVRQAAVSAGLAVGLPVAVLVEPRQAAAVCSGP